jgi:hypothetical protein
LLASSYRSRFEADLAVPVVSFSFINNSLCFGMFNVQEIINFIKDLIIGKVNIKGFGFG